MAKLTRHLLKGDVRTSVCLLVACCSTADHPPPSTRRSGKTEHVSTPNFLQKKIVKSSPHTLTAVSPRSAPVHAGSAAGWPRVPARLEVVVFEEETLIAR